jgi:CDP-glucose 4,6-dehydratase
VGGLAVNRWADAFRGRRIVVTGHTGFKGTWLCMLLRHLGADVVGYALPPERGNDHFHLLKLDALIHHVTGDVRELADLERVLQAFQPAFVFHLAAQALVRRSYDEPKVTFDTNVGGTVNVLEAARRHAGLKALVCVTSDKCYRNRDWVWGYRENDELGGHDPYSASKAAAELVVAAYTASAAANRPRPGIATARAGNVIGGGDWSPDRLVPDTLRAVSAGRPVPVRNPTASRPWQHVMDAVTGYALLAARLAEAPEALTGAWNFGPSSAQIRTVRDLVDTVVARWGSGEVAVDAGPHPHEDRVLHLNCDKARRLLGWHPRWDFERAVAETVDWYRAVLAGEDARDVTTRQIAAFLGDVACPAGPSGR